MVPIKQLWGDSANAVPHDRNYASEFPTFGEIAEVNSIGVQWSSLALGEPPCWSRLTPTPGKYVLMLVLMKVSLKHSHGRFDFLATYIWQNFEPTLVKFLGWFSLFKNGPSPASSSLILSFQTNITIFTIFSNKCEKYAELGFEPTTFGTWVSSHNHLTRAPP